MKKIYFASDLHLGIDTKLDSKTREILFCQWLDEIKVDASELFLMGDVFDFWFEYHRVVPKHFVRILGKLAELSDHGIQLHYFSGNHDLWLLDYFHKELNATIYHDRVVIQRGQHTFFLAHGDGLGPEDIGYKRMKKLFRLPLAQTLYRWLHPDLGILLASYFSRKSRSSQSHQAIYYGDHREWLVQYVEKKSKELQADFYVFGHRHLPIDYKLKNAQSRYINLGDWMQHFSYAVYDGSDLYLKFYHNPSGRIYP
ncbi:MAG TPA: UDP-2,3-diacylglucosamine diphosphatase [Saprospiraceae bacterium]|nr:UDP-2,3-diacylglucosamine diphosphatase [Saprospiraceae bacterium]